SSRRRHTRFSRDWSSDVCSSDLQLIAEQERAREERELAEQQVDERPPVETAAGLDNRKELEAEEFMRDAREREEVEKYGRIKRLKASVQEQEDSKSAQAAMRHGAYMDGAGQLYEGSEEMRMRNAAELEAFRSSLAQRERERRERGEQESTAAFVRVQGQELGREQLHTERTAEHSARTQEHRAAEQALQERLDRYAQANKERSDNERQRVEEQARRISEMEQRRSALAERQREEVERQKQARNVRDR